MELAKQTFSNDRIVRKIKGKYLKDFNSQSLAAPAEKGEQTVSTMPAVKQPIDLVGDDIVELSIENESLKNKVGSYDDKCLEESKGELLKQVDDGKTGNLLMSRMEKQMRKQQKMAFISFDKLCRNEFYNNVSAKNKVQEINLNQLKLKVNDT